MRNILFTTLVLVINLFLIGAGTTLDNSSNIEHSGTGSDIISCAPSFTDTTADEKGKFITVLPGLGRNHFKISTKNDSAQVYFNQGLNFYFSYHFRESLASFKEAARFDPDCPMAYWGQAISMGPYYNDYYYKMRNEVPDVVKLMKAFEGSATSKEKRLIQAMQLRYSTDFTNADRKQLDSNYAAALLKLTRQYKNDNDIAALYIDAMMLQHKWDFWNNDGSPKPWTTTLVNNCENILKNDPSHPAALHYYIHLTEAS